MANSRAAIAKRAKRRATMVFLNKKFKEILPHIKKYLAEKNVEIPKVWNWGILIDGLKQATGITHGGKDQKQIAKYLLRLTANGILPDIGLNGWDRIEIVPLAKLRPPTPKQKLLPLSSEGSWYVDSQSKATTPLPDPPVSSGKLISREKAEAFYLTYEWRKLRYETLLRYGKKCMSCDSERGPFHVDHIRPLRRHWHLRLDSENTQVLCEECNHGKGNWDETDFR